ncbi:transposase [Streptomyces sp. NPDC006365]|uniref:transposase n=1 Tax=Streptomyces sp. NPDC006365 TaxID=3364744 RepID=UPI0036990F1C
MSGVGTSILGRPRHLPRDRRASHHPTSDYTLNCEEPEIEALADARHSNAESEDINRVIRLVARAAFGFRNADRPTPTHALCDHPPSPRTPAPLHFEDPDTRALATRKPFGVLYPKPIGFRGIYYRHQRHSRRLCDRPRPTSHRRSVIRCR